MAAPVLVTGSHRSGTSWVGRMLCLSGELCEVYEPFSPSNRLSWLRHKPPHWYFHVGPDDEAAWTDDLDRLFALRPPLLRHVQTVRSAGQAVRTLQELEHWVLARARRSSALIKDPLAFFSAELLAERYGCRVVLLIRHPAAFAGSLKQARWYPFNFANFVNQPWLMENHLAGLADEIKAAAERPLNDVVDEAVLLWRCIYGTAVAYRDTHPDWIVIRHEDLATDAVNGTRDLYARLDLRWTNRVERRVRRLCEGSAEQPASRHELKRKSSAQLSTWRTRLTADEQERVRVGTADIATHFYTETDWLSG